MKNSWIWKLLLSLGMLLFAVYLLVPTYIYFSLDKDQLIEVRKDKAAFAKYLPWWSLESHIVPGLDLQGGIHIALGVDVDKAIADKTMRTGDRLVDEAKTKGLAFVDIKHEGERKEATIKVSFANSTDRTAFVEAMVPSQSDLYVYTETETEIGLRIRPEIVQAFKRDAVVQTRNTINNRIDKLGVTEPSITIRGEDQIQVQLPGYDNPEEAKALIGRTAQLEFQLCNDETDFLTKLTDLPEAVVLAQNPYRTERGFEIKNTYLEFPKEKLEIVKAYLKGKVPEGSVVKYGRPQGPPGSETIRTYTLYRKVDLTGDDLVDAKVTSKSQTDLTPAVSMTFSPTGGRIFADISEKNIGKRFAIVLEDYVDSVPYFNEKIPNGQAQIGMGSGRDSEKEALQLSMVLKSGALPAPVNFREELSVGPSLGADSIANAKKAFMWGGLLIILFMIFYYRVSGVISVLGVTFNVLFILATMAWLGATITLPGVAGLLLTVGMAVDVNIIINERIREELRLGKMPRSAVKAGYDAAFSAVIDSHVTTFIGGAVLYFTGTGPIQNFAAFLLIGTFFSIITGVIITRIFFDAMIHKGPETISI